MALDGAFNALLFMQKRQVKLVRPGSPNLEWNIYVSPSNYFRNLETVSEIVIKGREFVISKAILNSVSATLKRGDRIVDPEIGSSVIGEIREMYDFGGRIIGFRVRCE